MVPVMLKLITLVAIFSTAACTTDDGLAGEGAGDEGLAETGALEGSLTERARVNRADDYCAQLPADGACSLACDPEALVEQYVPKGTCVLITCTLDTGETFNTGGCND